MIPILYDSEEESFNTQGIGALADAVSCFVTEEYNSSYELTMTYPVTGVLFDKIAYRTIICAIPSPYRGKQPFRVYKITRPISGLVTVYAQHISYDLSNVVKALGTGSYIGIKAALAAVQSGILGTNHFTLWTDISSDAVWTFEKPATVRSLLGGVDGSILDVYGGEWEFDGFTAKLWKSRGADNNYSILYGKNMTALDAEYDGSDCTQAVLAYWFAEGSDTEVKQLRYGTAQATSSAPARWRVVDVTDEYETAPTTATLNARAKTILAEYDQEPTPSITVSFVPDAGNGNITTRGETLDLCDTVHVYFKDVLVDERRKVTKIKTNVLLERYEEITIGANRTGLEDTISSMQN